MTDQDKEALNKMAQDMLDRKFHHPMNSKEGALVLHDVSALLVKISIHIKKKIEDYEQSHSKGGVDIGT
jgi:hypothetical protein